jgi:hypothetical protein
MRAILKICAALILLAAIARIVVLESRITEADAERELLLERITELEANRGGLNPEAQKDAPTSPPTP